MSKRSALELSLRLAHNRRWGKGYRFGRRTMFTPISSDNGTHSEGSGNASDDTVVYIEHFRGQQQLSRKP
jgi:hypothetical protein